MYSRDVLVFKCLTSAETLNFVTNEKLSQEFKRN